MEAIATICSRVKDEREGLLAARLRYLGEHIGRVEKLAREKNMPLYILSGKFGLLSAEREIPNYDFLLEASAVPTLAIRLGVQLNAERIHLLHFYVQDGPKWAPYKDAMIAGAKQSHTKLVVNVLAPLS